MHISRLALDHYRSWDHCVLDFEPGINILQGSNGLGKTNIVEAVEVLSTGSSHRTSSSLPLVEKGHPSATVRANVEDAGEQRTYEITIAARGANRARVDGGKSQYMRDIVGLVPSVSFTPEDQRLVSGDPATRRNFLNQAASLLLPRYAQSLQQFTHVAKQRAALLKQLSDGSGIDPEYGRQAVLSGLEVWTGQFIALGVQLTKDRNDVIGLLREPFTRIYASLAGEEEQADLVYEPSFDEVLLFDEPAAEISRHFQRIYPGEVARGQNLIGPQRDDLTLRLNDMPAREFASNGEMWTMALGLKMALYEVVSAQRDVKPIVILDDVFAQLDESRRGQILDFARRQDQVLITVAAASDIPQGEAHVIDVAALRAQSQETDGDIAAMAAMLAAGRGAQSQGIEAES
ncbi:DNA replication/repair protein RecF [Bifidobacterium adolescentis]|jgi:DNA replication and repair protein RecF|uniref:DNA replication/repair protein RecF n=1 Tax=Bifidobacterium adolescentis TaxID=1680 RepID=UPI000E43A373|nr:DNA replication/repair protein RecF [Bifidobacterium adolescentis]RGL56064.1 DNA replication/repair protein RecF [Bifidobacterium adolescentis]RGL56890.1 DNA replication/repair protein RecF [Bifidobacterium adolescentis]RGL64909.1 DNA replication/repair protein RecF [Bifidobacterium adolescentis]